MQCCARDEGRSLGVGLQELASNHLMLRRSKASVVSDKEKALTKGQVTLQETTEKEPSMKCRKRKIDVKTGRRWLARDESGMHLFTALTASGTKTA